MITLTFLGCLGVGARPGKWGWHHKWSGFQLASEKVMWLAPVDLGMDYKVKHEQY